MRLWPVLLVVICTLLTSTAQILFKFGSQRLPDFSSSFVGILSGLLLDFPLIIGLCLYAVGAVLLIIALKHGDLSTLYPIIATSYVWVALLSHYVFSEPFGFWKIAGIITILAGVSLVNLGGKK